MIDSLEEACDYMITMLDESKHGSAYRRYMNMQADKQDKEKEKAEKFEDIARSSSGNTRKVASDKAYEHRKNATEIGNTALGTGKRDRLDLLAQNKYSYNSFGSGIRDNIKDDDNSGRYDREVNQARSAWKKDHGDSDVEERKPGRFKTSEGLSAKKESVKEACLYILSRLDEI